MDSLIYYIRAPNCVHYWVWSSYMVCIPPSCIQELHIFALESPHVEKGRSFDTYMKTNVVWTLQIDTFIRVFIGPLWGVQVSSGDICSVNTVLIVPILFNDDGCDFLSKHWFHIPHFPNSTGFFTKHYKKGGGSFRHKAMTQKPFCVGVLSFRSIFELRNTILRVVSL
jgi:hypothetical protein